MDPKKPRQSGNAKSTGEETEEITSPRGASDELLH